VPIEEEEEEEEEEVRELLDRTLSIICNSKENIHIRKERRVHPFMSVDLEIRPILQPTCCLLSLQL
jgi:hypothetical protein